jgi:hypothetical protein
MESWKAEPILLPPAPSRRTRTGSPPHRERHPGGRFRRRRRFRPVRLREWWLLIWLRLSLTLYQCHFRV